MGIWFVIELKSMYVNKVVPDKAANCREIKDKVSEEK